MKNHRPHHIGIIPDGNRRWAVAHGMPKEDGYQHGLKPGLMLLQQAKEAGIEEITYYGFTVDNCKRPKKQVSSFQKACVDAIDYLSWRVQIFWSSEIPGRNVSRRNCKNTRRGPRCMAVGSD